MNFQFPTTFSISVTNHERKSPSEYIDSREDTVPKWTQPVYHHRWKLLFGARVKSYGRSRLPPPPPPPSTTVVLSRRKWLGFHHQRNRLCEHWVRQLENPSLSSPRIGCECSSLNQDWTRPLVETLRYAWWKINRLMVWGFDGTSWQQHQKAR